MRPAVATPARIGLTLAVFLATLVLVAWRQTRAYTLMSEIERVNGEIALANAEGDDLRQRIQYLESLERVVVDARVRLGMHLPTDAERVILGEAVQ
jgi:cell division protein FtsL